MFRDATVILPTPAFFPEALINTMARYGDELMQQLLTNPDYRRESDRSIPAKWNVPNESATPLFVSVDFGLVRDEAGNVHPRLVELQAFPTLYAYQAVLGQQYKESFGLPAALKTIDRLHHGVVSRTSGISGELRRNS